jgi:hypothetical protein
MAEPRQCHKYFMATAVVNLAGGVPEEDVVVKQEDACCNRDVGVPEEDVD